ncbi:MAG TPA: glycosyltransferase family 4 protein [Thermodesulfobacteriota bacterium]|nr:glycosyltransferase family 4 protein [Candidatus Paceibacterota bacterium]HVY54293.1 glycosyltransferase family 4 protein [Thermodesulfobacteriota bacterium]
MKRRLFLVFHGRFPGEKAASLFAAKSAEAFADVGLEVTVLVPKRKGVDSQTAYDYFGVRNVFSIVEIPATELSPVFRKISFWMSYRSFSKGIVAYIKAHAVSDDIVYSNETLPLLAASRVAGNTFYEMHDFPESKLALFGRFLKKMKWVLVHNKWKMEKVERAFGISAERMLYEPNAVDIGAFDISVSKEEARKKLGLPPDKKIAVYTGHLYGWKGVDALAQAAGMLADDFLAVFVGGTDADVAAFKSKYGDSPRILIAGHKKYAEIPVWQKAADVLALPNSGKEAISLYYTSPMKLFEYMASRRPIVASDIPSIREIVDGSSASLVPPDDAKALADAIRTLASDSQGGEALAQSAFARVSSHTWEKRARRILSFIEKNG